MTTYAVQMKATLRLAPFPSYTWAMCDTNRAPRPKDIALVKLADGSKSMRKIVDIDDSTVTLSARPGRFLKLARADVAEIHVAANFYADRPLAGLS